MGFFFALQRMNKPTTGLAGIQDMKMSRCSGEANGQRFTATRTAPDEAGRSLDGQLAGAGLAGGDGVREQLLFGELSP